MTANSPERGQASPFPTRFDVLHDGGVGAKICRLVKRSQTECASGVADGSVISFKYVGVGEARNPGSKTRIKKGEINVLKAEMMRNGLSGKATMRGDLYVVTGNMVIGGAVRCVQLCFCPGSAYNEVPQLFIVRL